MFVVRISNGIDEQTRSCPYPNRGTRSSRICHATLILFLFLKMVILGV